MQEKQLLVNMLQKLVLSHTPKGQVSVSYWYQYLISSLIPTLTTVHLVRPFCSVSACKLLFQPVLGTVVSASDLYREDLGSNPIKCFIPLDRVIPKDIKVGRHCFLLGVQN